MEAKAQRTGLKSFEHKAWIRQQETLEENEELKDATQFINGVNKQEYCHLSSQQTLIDKELEMQSIHLLSNKNEYNYF